MRKIALALLLSTLILLLNAGVAACMGVSQGGRGGFDELLFYYVLTMLLTIPFWLLALYISLKIIVSVWFGAKIKYEMKLISVVQTGEHMWLWPTRSTVQIRPDTP